MKSPTKAYKNLRTSLKGIEKILSRLPEHDCLTDAHHLKVQSYLLLCHAAFEEYIESLAKIILDESVKEFNNKGEINRCIVSLIVFETVAQFDKNTPRKQIRANVVSNLSKFVNVAKNNHVGTINGNNGVKLRDQRAVLLPVGIDPEEADSVTAASLDAFGVKRGGIAHKFKIRTEETRSSAVSTVRALSAGVLGFDSAAVLAVQTRMQGYAPLLP